MGDILIMLWKILTELLKEILLDNHYKTKPDRCGRVVSASACHAGGLWFKSGILPLLKHACGESDWLLCWLYTPAEVSHQRWISGNVYHVHLRKVRIRQNPLWLWNPEVTRSPKQGYQWPQKWTRVQKKTIIKLVMDQSVLFLQGDVV